MAMLSSIVHLVSDFFFVDAVRDKLGALRLRDERFLNDLGLTRFQAEQLAGLPMTYDAVRTSTVLTAFEHGEVNSFVR